MLQSGCFIQEVSILLEAQCSPSIRAVLNHLQLPIQNGDEVLCTCEKDASCPGLERTEGFRFVTGGSVSAEKA